jgi:hypothetical protein
MESPPIKILFLTSDPSDATRLRLGEELREIREKLQLAKNRDRFLLESLESSIFLGMVQMQEKFV